MLVLAIAAVIIVMSVRYYQSASASQRANACLSYLQAVVAAADSLSEATQSYSQITSSEIDAIVPRNEAVCNQRLSDHGDTLHGGVGKAKFISINIPAEACRLMIPALKASGHWWYTAYSQIDESACGDTGINSWIAYHKEKE